MKTKEKLIDSIKNLPEEKIDKIFSEVIKPDKNKEMSDFLFSMFNETTMKFTGEKEFTFYNKKGEWMFQQDYKKAALWISYYRIWSVFEEKFGLNSYQIKDFIKAWVETNTEWQVLTPILLFDVLMARVETNTE